MKSEAWSRLIHGRSLSGLALDSKEGRLDLRRLVVPEPLAVRTISMDVGDVAVLKGMTVIRGATWESLDFSHSRLNGLRFFDCTIRDCVFDKCSCRDWRLWGTLVSDTCFHSADLRSSALGGVNAGKGNTFRNVDFTKADLRETAYSSARFEGCMFNNTRLDKVNFQGSPFVNCTFIGELSEVCFQDKAFGMGELPPNKMQRIDFSRAQLRSVEFRGLDLDNVRLPEDDEHIILNDYSRMLDKLLEAL